MDVESQKSPNLPLAKLTARASEIFISFQSHSEWSSWRRSSEAEFDSLRSRIVASVRWRGLLEPLSWIHRNPSCIAIDSNNLRESISVGWLNSRKRAALYMLESLASSHGLLPNRQLRILGAEAVTRAASLLRGAFPFYLGCEHLATPYEREQFFPIIHLDLNEIAFPDKSFDVFYSSDVFEHLPNVDLALREIYRILKPGGFVVSVFPFLSECDKSQTRSVLHADGSVEHLLPPEFHGNPVRPNEGSLVFTLPAWDILAMSSTVGFEETKMSLVASSLCGITANGPPGVFVFHARKSTAQSKARPPTFQRNIVFAAPELTRVIGVIGLPRSGTTVLTSILSVHSRIQCIYEPWNANKNDHDLDDHTTLAEFIDNFDVHLGSHDVLVLKETATDLRYIQRLGEVLRSTPIPLRPTLLVIIRDPFHTFLSEVEARRRWWGEPDLEISCASFDAWARRTLHSLERILTLAREFNALIISYERLAHDRQLIAGIMDSIALPIEEAQTEYEKHLDRTIVRGDVAVASAPKPLDSSSFARRSEAVGELIHKVSGSMFLNAIKRVEEAATQLQDTPLSRASDQEHLLRALIPQRHAANALATPEP